MNNKEIKRIQTEIIKGQKAFHEFVSGVGMDDEIMVPGWTWEGIFNNRLDTTLKKDMQQIYYFLNELLSKNYTEKELLKIWRSGHPKIVFSYQKEIPRPVKSSIVWRLLATIRDMCGERLGLQGKKPRII